MTVPRLPARWETAMSRVSRISNCVVQDNLTQRVGTDDVPTLLGYPFRSATISLAIISMAIS